MGAHYAASLRVSSAARDRAGLTALLGVEPDACHERGSPYTRSGRSGTREQTLWLLESGLAYEAPLEEHLRALLGRLGTAGAAAVASLPEGCDADLFCMLNADPGAEATFDPALLDGLAATGASLGLDLYPPVSAVLEPVERVTYGPLVAPPGTAVEGLTALLDAGVPPGASWLVTHASSYGQGGIEIEPPLLRRLAEAGAPLTVRI